LIECSDGTELKTLKEGESYITGDSNARVKPLTLDAKVTAPKMSATAVVSSARIYVPLGHLIDVEKTRGKLVLQRDAVLKDIAKVRQTLDNPDFKKRAPADKVAAQEAALAEAEARLETIESQLKLLES
jgi:valyl-tRNA synthetase